MARRPRYASEFKAQAVRMVLEDGSKVCEVTDQLVLSPDTLKKRLRAARAGNAFPAQQVMQKTWNWSGCGMKYAHCAWNVKY